MSLFQHHRVLRHTMRWVLCCMTVLVLTSSGLLWAESPSQNPYQTHRGGIWDGTLTKASSGSYWGTRDSGSSEGKSGVKESAQKFYIPPPFLTPRFYDELDPDEAAGRNRVQSYSPDALLRLTRSVWAESAQKMVAPGFYQVHLGVTLTDDAVPASLTPSVMRLNAQGRVLATFPITRVVPYVRAKGAKKRSKKRSRKPRAALLKTPNGWVIRVVHRGLQYDASAPPPERPVVYPSASLGDAPSEASQRLPQ